MRTSRLALVAAAMVFAVGLSTSVFSQDAPMAPAAPRHRLPPRWEQSLAKCWIRMASPPSSAMVSAVDPNAPAPAFGGGGRGAGGGGAPPGGGGGPPGGGGGGRRGGRGGRGRGGVPTDATGIYTIPNAPVGATITITANFGLPAFGGRWRRCTAVVAAPGAPGLHRVVHAPVVQRRPHRLHRPHLPRRIKLGNCDRRS